MSFEEAISGRIIALGINWDLSREGAAITEKKRAISPVTAVATSERNGQGWQRYITYICLALMFMLMGFDLMGLLILHTH